MHKSCFIGFALAVFLCSGIFVPIREANTTSVPSKVRLFDPRTLYIHGYLVYKYNCPTPASIPIPVFVEVWANNFWSDVRILQTASSSGGKTLGVGYVKSNVTSGKYDLTEREDHNSIYGAQFNFTDVEPYQEIRTDVWIKLSISKVDMTNILNETVGNISEASNQLGADYETYVNETYYWDYGNASVQDVIQEINQTAGGSNVYDLVYATIDWFSTHMIYREHEDYPDQRLKASQVLNETIEVTGDGEKRYGVCRHFADGFVAVMRGFGIPCNLFNGLVFSDIGGTVGVVFSGGHAWCEVYMPSIGWVPVEVTISDRYIRDVVRVGLISPYYYLPIRKEFTNSEPEETDEQGEPEEPYEHLIAAYWGWSVGEVPVLTLEGLIHAVVSMPIINWILLVAVIVLIVDSIMVRRKIKALTEHTLLV